MLLEPPRRLAGRVRLHYNISHVHKGRARPKLHDVGAMLYHESPRPIHPLSRNKNTEKTRNKETHTHTRLKTKLANDPRPQTSATATHQDVDGNGLPACDSSRRHHHPRKRRRSRNAHSTTSTVPRLASSHATTPRHARKGCTPPMLPEWSGKTKILGVTI